MLLMTGNFPNVYEMAAGNALPPPSPPPPSPPPPSPPPPTTIASCQVSYGIVNQWNTGFQANIIISNRASTAVSGYTLAWKFAGGETIRGGWNATFAENGTSVTASNPAGNWNGTIGAGSSVTFGFIGNGTGRVPASFTLNGAACQT